MAAQPLVAREPIDDLQARLNDPQIAASLGLLLDNVEALAFLAMGVNGLLQRGDTIAETLASGVAEIREATANGGGLGIEPGQVQDLLALTSTLAAKSDDLDRVLSSGMLDPAMVGVLSETADAVVEARAAAASSEPEIQGLRSAFKVLKDPEVQRGMSFLVGVARGLGRRMGT